MGEEQGAPEAPVVVIIGAGSLEFSARLSADLLTFPACRGAELRLVDVDAERLAFAGRILERLQREAAAGDLRWSLHTDRREALPGADVVITSILVGGYPAIEAEIDIPARHGVSQAIGDTLTPGGIMRCLRTLPVQGAIAQDVMALCPDAWLLNYTNPMGMLCQGMAAMAPGVKLVGLCHSVQHTTALWAHRLGVPLAEVDFLSSGINHQAWLTRFGHRGTDLLPRIRELAEHPRIWRKDSSRLEMIKHFGFPVTEMSGHNSEYHPWFRKSSAHVAAYCPGGEWNGGHGFIKTLYNRPDWRDTMADLAEGRTPISLERSEEYGAWIVNALVTGEPVKIHGNVVNDGLVPNLPADGCVEVPCLVDRDGVQPLRVPPLPPQLAAINSAQLAVQGLAVAASLERDPERVFQAMALDPLTGAVCTLDEVRAMTRELLAAHAPWLPGWEGVELAARPVLASFGDGATDEHAHDSA